MKYCEFFESVEIPPEPGTVPIPPNTVRRFHVTSLKNCDNITTHGLTMEYARNIDGTKGIYSWNNYPRAVAFSKASSNPGKFLLMGNHAIIVEFFDDERNYNNDEAGRTNCDINPNQIIAIHKLWHTLYYLVKNNQMSIDRLRSGVKSEPQVQLALDALEK